MKICFSGFENPIIIGPGKITVLEIHNRTLFARICTALNSGNGLDAKEPYSIWDDDEKEIAPSGRFLLCNPLSLPVKNPTLSNHVYERIECLIKDNEEIRSELERTSRHMNSLLSQTALQLASEYTFNVEWSIAKYLKSFGFGVNADESEEPILDRLIKFFALTIDAGLRKTLLFTNLKTFFSRKDLETLYDQVVFSGISLLLVENTPDEEFYKAERKYVVDQHFLEN